MDLRQFSLATFGIWAVLVADAAFALYEGRFSVVLVCATVFVLTVLPLIFSRRVRLSLPKSFVAVFSIFVFSTLFLGELLNFYERFWWWDLTIHGGSAVALGIVGFLFVFALFDGDGYAAPPLAMAGIALALAVTIGTLWEIFEFAADQIFGLNMQKSGLVDTMWDLIVDSAGAAVGAGLGYAYLKGARLGVFEEFVRRNRALFARFRRRA